MATGVPVAVAVAVPVAVAVAVGVAELEMNATKVFVIGRGPSAFATTVYVVSAM